MVSDTTTVTVTNTETEETTELPQFNAKGSIAVNSFKYQKALFSNISTLFNVSNDLYIVDQFKVDAFKGHVNSSVKYLISNDDRTIISFKTNTNNIDINEALSDFDDFEEYGNDYINQNQISGTLSSNLAGRCVMMDSLLMDSIRVSGTIKLENGRLKDYEPTMMIANKNNINDLKDMQFKTIDSKIFTYNGAIFMPQTDVNSNALNITVYGMQKFNEDCEYHLRVFPKEYLRGKTDRIKRKQEEQRVRNSGGTAGLISIFPFYIVENGKSKTGLSTKNKRETMKDRVMLQQMKLDMNFHPHKFKFNTGVEY
jgi:hypothetical protein